jgi:hypothetical protein
MVTSRKLLEIPNTTNLLIQAWRAAEESLLHDISLFHPDADEEFITQLFHGKYGAILSFASQQKYIENAFLADLRSAFPTLGAPLNKIASGLVAEITIHKRSTEKITGGDIGFLVSRPQISHGDEALLISDYRRGLLCQAKLKNSAGKWGTFTKRQKQVLPERLPYLGLLLYSYADASRRTLNLFNWQVCNDSNIDEVSAWLKNGDFPSMINSDKIISGLSFGKIGTDNDDIINSAITPTKNSSIVIRINWPDDQHPGSSVRIYSKQENQVKQKVSVYQS